MLEAHDEVGLIVTGIDDPALSVWLPAAGQTDGRLPPSGVHGDKPYAGVFAQPRT